MHGSEEPRNHGRRFRIDGYQISGVQEPIKPLVGPDYGDLCQAITDATFQRSHARRIGPSRRVDETYKRRFLSPPSVTRSRLTASLPTHGMRTIFIRELKFCHKAHCPILRAVSNRTWLALLAKCRTRINAQLRGWIVSGGPDCSRQL
jgi:hypothetical protein